MSETTTSPPNADALDPVYVHSRREGLVIFAVWATCLVWAVSYCYLNGFAGHVDPDDLVTVYGVPSWVFWGIAVPWLLADVFTAWFCFFYMKDDDLGEGAERIGDDSDDEERQS